MKGIQEIIDIWVHRTRENYKRIVKAFNDFGMPVFDMNLANFLKFSEIDVFSFGVSPVRIDLMTQAKGLEFNEAYSSAEIMDVEGLEVKVVMFEHLIELKNASNRSKDQNDIEHLKRIKKNK